MFNVVPTRFRRELILHLFKNLVPRPDAATPLILGVHGPSGEGKTYQCRQILEEVDISASLVSGGELESVDAGEPARLVRSKYLECAVSRTSHEKGLGLVALVFNDIDAAIGDWGDQVQYTVNRQNIFGELMHLADFPNFVEGRRVERVPIIITGNDFTKLYGPLIRPGRMRSFSWSPTIDEKREVLEAIYPELSGWECLELIQSFPEQPVAFFSDLRSQLIEDILWQHVIEIGPKEAFARVAQGARPRLSNPVSLPALVARGETLLRAGEIVNHLKR